MKRHRLSTYLGVGVVFVIFLAGIIIISTPPTRSEVAHAAANECTFDSGTKYPLGDTENNKYKTFDANNTDFYDTQQSYYFITLPSDDLSINPKFFQDAQADGNGYDLYPKLASIVGFIPIKVLNAYHLKHKTKNTAATGDDKPFQNAIVEVQTTPNQDIKVPVSGYNILYGFNPPKGQGNGPAGLLMWTNGTSFVFQIGRADNPRNIFVYVYDVCVDKALVNAYNSANAAGRNQLPELQTGQIIAKTKGDRTRLGMRDNGVFVEARTPYVWDTNYQKTGTSTYPISPPSLQSGSLNSSLPVGAVKSGWPNPQDPALTAAPTSPPAPTDAPNTKPSATPTPSPTIIPTVEPSPSSTPTPKSTPPTSYHVTFTTYPPAGFGPGRVCDITFPYCRFIQLAQKHESMKFCTTSDKDTCSFTAAMKKVTMLPDGANIFDFQVEDPVTQEDMGKLSYYLINSDIFCYR